MQIENLSEGANTFTANVYLIDDRVLIDAGAAPTILEHIGEKEIETLVVTHSHHDHIENLPAIANYYAPDIYAFNPDNLPVDAHAVTDNDTITLANHHFRILHTPGHKNDSICLYNKKERVLFSGDLVFPDGYFGRTDLAEGDQKTLVQSIERVADLDVEQLFAGHDPPVRENANAHIAKALAQAQKGKQPNA